MDVAEFDFTLPDDLIAQAPALARDGSRLLVLHRASGAVSHATVSDLPGLLRRGDLLVVNNTRVFPARLLGTRVPSGGAVECLLLARHTDGTWEALMHPGQKLRQGSRVSFEAGGVRIDGEVLRRLFYGRRVIRLWREDAQSVEEAIDAIGHVPLPPYIKRPDTAVDLERYQTVFAKARGSAAAPTAGLHFSERLLDALDGAGVGRAEITLHVGYGTFKPVRVDRVEEHEVDPEPFEIAGPAASAINAAIQEGRRIIAVGTTTTRALETAAAPDGGVRAGAGVSSLFIYPGYRFRIVQGLVTNFHLPRSSLLMLVAAFAGRDRVMAAYREAVERRYRFYSYGDAMLVL